MSRYKLVSRLESRTLSDVFMAQREGSDATHGSLCKFFLNRFATPEFALALAKAGQEGKDVCSPLVISYDEVGYWQGHLVAVRQSADGYALDDVIRRLNSKEVVLTPQSAIFLAAEAAKTIQLIHGQGKVHGALDATNLFLGFDGAVRTGDMGMMRVLDASPAAKLTASKIHRGYRAPELRDPCKGTMAGDVYALGCLAYELLTLVPVGSVRGGGLSTKHDTLQSPSRLNRRINARVDPVVMKALEPAASRRYRDAGEFASQLMGLFPTIGQLPTTSDLAAFAKEVFPNEVSLSGGTSATDLPVADFFQIEAVAPIVSRIADGGCQETGTGGLYPSADERDTSGCIEISSVEPLPLPVAVRQETAPSDAAFGGGKPSSEEDDPFGSWDAPVGAMPEIIRRDGTHASARGGESQLSSLSSQRDPTAEMDGGPRMTMTDFITDMLEQDGGDSSGDAPGSDAGQEPILEAELVPETSGEGTSMPETVGTTGDEPAPTPLATMEVECVTSEGEQTEGVQSVAVQPEDSLPEIPRPECARPEGVQDGDRTSDNASLAASPEGAAAQGAPADWSQPQPASTPDQATVTSGYAASSVPASADSSKAGSDSVVDAWDAPAGEMPSFVRRNGGGVAGSVGDAENGGGDASGDASSDDVRNAPARKHDGDSKRIAMRHYGLSAFDGSSSDSTDVNAVPAGAIVPRNPDGASGAPSMGVVLREETGEGAGPESGKDGSCTFSVNADARDMGESEDWRVIQPKKIRQSESEALEQKSRRKSSIRFAILGGMAVVAAGVGMLLGGTMGARVTAGSQSARQDADASSSASSSSPRPLVDPLATIAGEKGEPAYLSIHSDVPATVIVNGEPFQDAPFDKVRLKPGHKSLRVIWGNDVRVLELDLVPGRHELHTELFERGDKGAFEGAPDFAEGKKSDDGKPDEVKNQDDSAGAKRGGHAVRSKAKKRNGQKKAVRRR